MKKEILFRLFCIVLCPAMTVTAQRIESAPAAAPAPAGTAAAPAPAPVSTMNAQIAVPEKPLFADSLMRGYQVETFQKVLKTAEIAKFDYKTMLENAKKGDETSIYKMFDFHRMVDGVDGLNHAVTCLEIIPLAGDKASAAAAYRCSPKLRKLLIERLMLAQVRTKKTFLRQSLTNWAPGTWAYLNGQTFQFGPQETPAAQQPAAQAKPATTNTLMPDSTQIRTRKQ